MVGRLPVLTSVPRTVAELLDWGEARLSAARVVCGHGTATYRDEAAALVYHVMGLDHADPGAYRHPVTAAQFRRVADLLTQRIERRVPVAYLLGEAWFAGLPFYVDPRVLIPRSPFAELIAARFSPWLQLRDGMRVLDIGTGSGCIAVATALAIPGCTVVATDLAWPALEVARRNVLRHGVEQRVLLVQADLLRGIRGRFDLIISNPPYVSDAELSDVPPEFGQEPRGALAGGPDGLELVRRILQDAPDCLEEHGWLALEVGGGAQALEQAYPGVAFVWPEFEHGGDGVALVAAPDLAALRGGSLASAR